MMQKKKQYRKTNSPILSLFRKTVNAKCKNCGDCHSNARARIQKSNTDMTYPSIEQEQQYIEYRKSKTNSK